MFFFALISILFLLPTIISFHIFPRQLGSLNVALSLDKKEGSKTALFFKKQKNPYCGIHLDLKKFPISSWPKFNPINETSGTFNMDILFTPEETLHALKKSCDYFTKLYKDNEVNPFVSPQAMLPTDSNPLEDSSSTSATTATSPSSFENNEISHEIPYFMLVDKFGEDQIKLQAVHYLAETSLKSKTTDFQRSLCGSYTILNFKPSLFQPGNPYQLETSFAMFPKILYAIPPKEKQTQENTSENIPEKKTEIISEDNDSEKIISNKKNKKKNKNSVVQVEKPIYIRNKLVSKTGYRNITIYIKDPKDQRQTQFDETKIEIQNSFKQLIPKDSSHRIEKQDIVILDMFGYEYDGNAPGCKGAPLKNTTGFGTDIEIEVVDGKYVHGFNDQIIGLQVNQTKTFSLNFPNHLLGAGQSLSGQLVTLEVTVKSINDKVLPTWDEHLAQRINATLTLDVLEQEIKREIDEKLNKTIDNLVNEALVNELTKIAHVERISDEVTLSLGKLQFENSMKMLKKQGMTDEQLEKLSSETYFNQFYQKNKQMLYDVNRMNFIFRDIWSKEKGILSTFLREEMEEMEAMEAMGATKEEIENAMGGNEEENQESQENQEPVEDNLQENEEEKVDETSKEISEETSEENPKESSEQQRVKPRKMKRRKRVKTIVDEETAARIREPNKLPNLYATLMQANKQFINEKKFQLNRQSFSHQMQRKQKQLSNNKRNNDNIKMKQAHEVDFNHPEIRSRVFRILKQYVKVVFVDHSEIEIQEKNSKQFQEELLKEKEEELQRYQQHAEQQQQESEDNDNNNNNNNNEESQEHISDAQIVSN